jgi:hypothetical protein
LGVVHFDVVGGDAAEYVVQLPSLELHLLDRLSPLTSHRGNDGQDFPTLVSQGNQFLAAVVGTARFHGGNTLQSHELVSHRVEALRREGKRYGIVISGSLLELLGRSIGDDVTAGND